MKIEKLSDREHILRRPSMYIGGISNEVQESFTFVESSNSLKVSNKTLNPGLIKIINEVIDNSIDIILKSKKGNRVVVTISEEEVVVEDNSVGFPINGKFDETEPLVIALGNARAGSNFNDAENIGQMGTNGVGAFATNCFSTKFEAVSNNGKSEIRATWSDNASILEISKDLKNSKTTKTGTIVKFLPDLEKFGIKEITGEIRDEIRTRLACLAYTYPKISFIFNGKEISKPKQIVDWLEVNDDPFVSHKTEDYEVFVIARSSNTPNFSFVNGLNVKDGGTHLEVISNDLSKAFQALRGFGEVSKADIQNTLQLVFVGSRFKNLRFNSQTKEKITNSTKEVRDYLGSLDALVNKVTKSKEIKDFIKATKDSREMRANKSKLTQAKKAKIKSDKFLDAQGQRKILMLVEGDSALGGLLPALGRKEIAYYALKGKPLNSWSISTQKVTANKELSELMSIIHNSDFEKIVCATDQDLDGIHIRGLLSAFVFKWAPEYLDKLYFLNTPVRGVTDKSGELKRWSYNLHDDLKIQKSEISQYYKGLGTFDREDLQKVIKTDGFENILSKISIDPKNEEDVKIMEHWLGDDSAPRKGYILENDFSIVKI